MSITHIIRCDVKLPNGQCCEHKAEMRMTHELPPGWITLQGSRKQDLSESYTAKIMTPIIDAAEETLDETKPEQARMFEKMKQLSARQAEAEQLRPVPTFAHVCPEHVEAMPKVEATDSGHGCVY